MTTTTAYKCVNKVGTQYYSQFNDQFELGKTVTSQDGWGYCCLADLNDAKNLLQTYTADAIECNTAPIWNTIVEIETTQSRDTWAPYKNTLTVMNFTIKGEIQA